MKPIKDIQQLINERAEDKLNKKIAELFDYLQNGVASTLRDMGDSITLTVNGQTLSWWDATRYRDRPIFEKIKEKLLPAYIENETKEFVQQVDGLRKQMENIVGQLPEFGEF